MKNFRIINIFLCLLALAFVAGGVLLMREEISRENKYALELERAVSAAASPNNYELEEAEAEATAISAEIDANSEQILTLQEDIAAKNEAITKLQQEYDKVAAEVNAEYYYSIIESLSEGVSLVESHLNDQN